MICKKCGIEITSDKIWNIHIQECKSEAVNYTSMDYQILKKIASSKGINVLKMKKEEIIKSLLELEG